ncbi:hypothetical protein [Ponticaulis profundi]|uniref:Uncharacterized protein n=1 Tax=Ponticaulis profundi TaxID=2665222 RepID=A0ABW1SBU6_9PROT
MSTPQINVRAPEEARKTLQRLGGHLRDNPEFLGKLEAFLDDYEGGAAGPTVTDRLADLEARVARLEK